MFLKEIKVTNFKCLSNISLSFEKDKRSNRKWTLILGENGTGKSNVLKAIALLTSGSNALGELLGNIDSWIKLGENSCSISAVIETKRGEERDISLKFERGDNLSKVISNNRESLHLIDEAIENANRNYFIVAYGASRRLSNEVFSNFEKSRNARSMNVRNLFDNSSTLNPLTAWIIELDYRSGEEGINLVKEALSDFLPGIIFHSIDKEKKQVMFKTIDGLISLDQLSDGYQNMAAWIGDLLFRITEAFRGYKKPLESRGLLLIDELDLHLHPKWQRKLLEFISKKLPNFQVVATTHSPLTAQQAGTGELFALKRNDKDVVEIIPFIGSPKSLLVNQLLMTPVFGLETDESYEIQNVKKEYEVLKSKGDSLNETEKKTMKIVKSKLKDLPQRNVLTSSSKELELLQKIEEKLNIKI
ncbi:Predicted ATP-binding protein involved in virulence [Flavobacterium sp. CF108]|uniref:AAA family ATPase n=1 Tax=unclassified Flavobacterium TaxID=196869 RepID=UPI0008C65095|nr:MULTISPECIES: AAA family ATPase [unclassified Flavobacterium]SEO19104.1 Predicted ATP-binding protein involved in virulence [Flavobacterium sp. fv08]SHG54062.1 Predicted ATP-binding protein involved in virulence [Flavobacterium sp. CF108]